MLLLVLLLFQIYLKIFGENGDIYTLFSQSSEQLTNIMNKTISPKIFSTLYNKLGITNIYALPWQKSLRLWVLFTGSMPL